MGKQQVGKSSSDVRDHTNASNFHLVDPTVPQQEEGLSFYMQLLSMLFGILGIMYRMRVFPLCSLLFSLISFANTKKVNLDAKTVLTGLTLCFMGLFLSFRIEMTEFVQNQKI